MNETASICEKCNNKSLIKIPSFISVAKTDISTSNNKKKYIDACEDTKQNLTAAKESIKGRVWKP